MRQKNMSQRYKGFSPYIRPHTELIIPPHGASMLSHTSFEEVSRKVDWLINEVCTLRQALRRCEEQSYVESSCHTRYFGSHSSNDDMSRDTSYQSNAEEDNDLRLERLFSMSGTINIAEVIMLWNEGTNDILPILHWSNRMKQHFKESLKKWFCVYHLFSTLCGSDIQTFVSRYTNSLGHMMSVSQVASMCPNIDRMFEDFINSCDKPDDVSTAKNSQSVERDNDKVHVLPRKINGRKVSAKDVIQLWEYGIGDIPPIKSWNKTQKFKQQSKISRWKKIVDIFKFQCEGDMKKFETIYTDSHGCLLPVAAITTKFETIYGDELNITSKLMTVSTDSKDDDVKHSSPPQLMKIKNGVDEISKICGERTEGNMHECCSKDGFKTNREGKHLLKKSIKHEDASDVRDSYQKKHFSIDFDARSSNSDSNCSDLVEESSEEIPKDLSIFEALELYESGSSHIVPIKDWTCAQKSNQPIAFKIVTVHYIYESLFRSDIDLFKNMCTANGKILTVDGTIDKFKDSLPKRITQENGANSMTFDFSHHKTVSANSDVLYLLPRKINGKKISASDVLQLWYYGLNKIPPVKSWSAQQKSVQQSKISRWKKIVDMYEKEYQNSWEKFKHDFSNSSGQLLPITAIIAKRDEEMFKFNVQSYPYM